MSHGIGGTDTVTLDEFEQIIIGFDKSGVGTRPISFTSVTNPKLKSVKPGFLPWAKLYKVGQTNGQLGADYENSVNLQREREGMPSDFKKQKLSIIVKWISDSIGITTTGLKVLVYYPKQFSPSYWVVETNDGQFEEIPKETALQYIRPPSPVASNQGTEKKVEWRYYGFDKIVGASFLKDEYMISNVDPSRQAAFELVRDKLKS